MSRSDGPRSTHEYEQPTDEQLVNFATVIVHGPGASDEVKSFVRDLLSTPSVKAAWLDRHRNIQEAAWTI